MMTRTALVTGASSGIGLELSRKLAKNGYKLVIVAQNRERLDIAAEFLRAENGAEVYPIAMDLAWTEAPGEIVARIKEMGLAIDLLVNNAGFGLGGRFYRMDQMRIERMLRVNIEALTALTRKLLPDMVKRGKGRILNVASTGSFVPGPYNAVYCAAKAYVLSLSRALSVELRGTGVTVTALCPGSTSTRFARTAGMEDTLLFHTSMDPKQVADAGYRAVRRGRAVVIPGLFNKLQILMVRVAPMGLASAVSGLIQKKRD